MSVLTGVVDGGITNLDAIRHTLWGDCCHRVITQGPGLAPPSHEDESQMVTLGVVGLKSLLRPRQFRSGRTGSPPEDPSASVTRPLARRLARLPAAGLAETPGVAVAGDAVSAGSTSGVWAVVGVAAGPGAAGVTVGAGVGTAGRDAEAAGGFIEAASSGGPTVPDWRRLALDVTGGSVVCAMAAAATRVTQNAVRKVLKCFIACPPGERSSGVARDVGAGQTMRQSALPGKGDEKGDEKGDGNGDDKGDGALKRVSPPEPGSTTAPRARTR